MFKHFIFLIFRYIAGKKSLAQIFSDYEVEINKAAQAQANQAKVGTVNVSNNASGPASADTASSQATTAPPAKVSRRARLKAAIRDYGSTVIVFHVAISLASLGIFYTLLARYKNNCGKNILVLSLKFDCCFHAVF